MSTEESKTIVRRLIEEIWTRGNLALADEMLFSGISDGFTTCSHAR